jgi:1-phosphofructokinase
VGDDGRDAPTTDARACVFAPAPLLTATIERLTDGTEEIHLHAGGQGFWIARMLSRLGVPVTLCGSFGGESGPIIRQLIEAADIRVREVSTGESNGVYIHDRRSGERVVVAETHPSPLDRHEADELYGTVIGESVDATVCILAGPGSDEAVPPEMYTRLAGDLRVAEVPTVADLSGDRLQAVLEAGVTVLKVSHEELAHDGVEADLGAIRRMAAQDDGDRPGADNVVVTRAHDPALALLDGQLYEVVAPRLQPVDHRGAGDSLTAGVAAGLARGQTLPEALRLGAAAGGLNVTRHGLATGTREDIESLVRRVELKPIDEAEGEHARPDHQR